MTWQADIKAEFEKADRARQRGNEGQARVCARRAAGIAAREYLRHHGKLVRTPSAYDLLQLVLADTNVRASIRESAARLTLRVDEEFRLPPDIDLIAEAKRFCEGLFPGSLDSP